MRSFNKSFLPFVAAVGLLAATNAFAQQTVTFDGVTVSGSSLPIDLDADTQPDLVISSPSGDTLAINSATTQLKFASVPVLFHYSDPGAEFRLDFPHGLNGGFSIDLTIDWVCGSGVTGVPAGATDTSINIQLFENGNTTPVDSQTFSAICQSPAGTSAFVEARAAVTSVGNVDYALVNLVNHDGLDRRVLSIDNISGAFVSAAPANSVPALPAPILGLLVLLTSWLGFRFRSKF